MTDSIKASYQAMIGKLKHQAIRVVHSMIITQEEPIAVDSPFPSLPASILELYASIELMNCKWVLKPDLEDFHYLDEDLDIITGELHLPSLKELDEKKDPKIYLAYLDPYELLRSTHPQEDFLSYIPLDYLSSNLAVCYKAGPENQGDLFLLDFSESGSITPLPGDLHHYLKTGFAHYFFYGWQKAAFLDDSVFQKTIDFYIPQLFN